MRTTAVATSTINDCRRRYATEQYRQAGLRRRGIGCECLPSVFYIISNKLKENETTDYLTAQQRDSLIDYLQKLLNK